MVVGTFHDAFSCFRDEKATNIFCRPFDFSPIGVRTHKHHVFFFIPGMAPLGLVRVNTFPTSSSGLPSWEVTFAEQTKQAGYTNGFFGT